MVGGEGVRRAPLGVLWCVIGALLALGVVGLRAADGGQPTRAAAGAAPPSGAPPEAQQPATPSTSTSGSSPSSPSSTAPSTTAAAAPARVVFSDMLFDPKTGDGQTQRFSVPSGGGDRRPEAGGGFLEDQRSPDGASIVAAVSGGTQQDCYRRPACVRTDSSSIVISAPDGSGSRTIVSGGYDVRPTWARATGLIAYQSLRAIPTGAVFAIAVAHADGTQAALIAADPPGVENKSPAWSGDGNTLAYFQTVKGQDFPDLRVHDMRSGADRLVLRSVLSPQADALQQVALSPDGSRAALFNVTGTTVELIIVPTAGGAPAALWRASSAGARGKTACDGQPATLAVEGPFWSPDGRTLAWAANLGHELEPGYPADLYAAPVSGGAAPAVAFRSPRGACPGPKYPLGPPRHQVTILGWLP